MTGAPRDRSPTLAGKCAGDLFERNDSVWPGRFGGAKNLRGPARIFERSRMRMPRERYVYFTATVNAGSAIVTWLDARFENSDRLRSNKSDQRASQSSNSVVTDLLIRCHFFRGFCCRELCTQKEPLPQASGIIRARGSAPAATRPACTCPA